MGLASDGLWPEGVGGSGIDLSSLILNLNRTADDTDIDG